MRGLLAALAGRERAVLVLTFYAERDSREIGLGSGPRRTTSGPFATGPWPGCARRGEAVGALRDGIRGAARRGWHGVLLPSIVERLARDGVRLHTYRLRPGIPVPCSVEPEDDLMIGRLEADLTGVERLDLELTAGADVVGAQRFEDVPIDRRAGEVILCMPAAIARPLPAHQMRVRLVVGRAAPIASSASTCSTIRPGDRDRSGFPLPRPGDPHRVGHPQYWPLRGIRGMMSSASREVVMIGSGWEGRFGLGFMIAVGLVTSSWLVARTVERAKRSDQAVSVKGYAERKITSDFASWSGTFRAHAPQLVAAYEQLRREREAVVEWLAKAGVKREVVRLSAVTTSTSLRRDAHGHETSQIEAYHLAQEVSIEGTDVGLVERVSHGATDLIQNGVEIESGKPRFLYTRLNELKLQLLGEATKDARARAEQLAANGGGKVGALRSAEQGVFQITSAHSTEVSGSGEYDTESRDKVVKAVVTVRYLVE